MDILIVTNSPVVLEMFKMAFLDKDINMEFVKSVDEAKKDSYFIVFIDDTVLNIDSQIDTLENYINYNELVGIVANEADFANHILKKPFLPENLTSLVNSILKEADSKDEPANVLDLEEIEKIKSIIALNESEELFAKKSVVEKLKDKESFKAKNKKAKKILKELCKMSNSELDELFASAKVTIKVDFKDLI